MQIGNWQRFYQPAGGGMIGIALTGKTGNHVKADRDIRNFRNKFIHEIDYEFRSVVSAHCGQNRCRATLQREM